MNNMPLADVPVLERPRRDHLGGEHRALDLLPRRPRRARDRRSSGRRPPGSSSLALVGFWLYRRTARGARRGAHHELRHRRRVDRRRLAVDRGQQRAPRRPRRTPRSRRGPRSAPGTRSAASGESSKPTTETSLGHAEPELARRRDDGRAPARRSRRRSRSAPRAAAAAPASRGSSIACSHRPGLQPGRRQRRAPGRARAPARARSSARPPRNPIRSCPSPTRCSTGGAIPSSWRVSTHGNGQSPGRPAGQHDRDAGALEQREARIAGLDVGQQEPVHAPRGREPLVGRQRRDASPGTICSSSA